MGDAGLLYIYAAVFVAAAATWLFGDFFRSKKADDDDELAERYTVNDSKKYPPLIAMGVSLFLFVEGGGLKLLFD